MNYELQEVELQIAYVKHTIRQYQAIQEAYGISDVAIQEKLDKALDLLNYLIEKREKLKNK
ncbi:MAG: hypothetical protein LIP01_07140 [Tannerellaceae bacterium]|nr:hypothetical protein [Tannerellaceae bacterium]